MKKVVFDSFALIALFRGEKGYDFVRDLLVRIANDEAEGFISAINVGEIYYMISRKSNVKNAEIAINSVRQMPLQISEPDLKSCLHAASIKAKHSLSYADAFAASLAIDHKAVLITGDPEFKSLAGEPGFKVKYII
jgi:predicted nucleic acid-binding protein